MAKYDHLALKQGASVTLLFAVPPTLVARFIIDNSDSSSGWAPLLSLLAIFGFILGSGVAAWHQTVGRPLVHGLIAGTGVFVAVQALFLILRATTGGEVRIGRIATAFSLSLVASSIGGVLGSFLQNSGTKPR